MELNKNSVQMQRVKILQYKGKEVLLIAPNYKEAKQWMNAYLAKNDNDLSGLEAIEFDTQKGLYINSINDIQTDTPIFCGQDEEVLDKLTKGYDTDEEAYVFSLVNVSYSAHLFPAQDVDEAIKMLQNGEFQQSNLLEEGSYFKVFSCSEENRAVVNGVTIP